MFLKKGNVLLFVDRNLGEKILADMEGKTVAEYTFKKTSQAVNMAQTFKMATSDGEMDIDPNLLFQRLTAILLSCRKNDVEIDLSGLFSFSLCPYPAALASSPSKMLIQPSKALILQSFEGSCKVQCPPSDPNIKYVIDGGFMLHSIVNWKQQKSFDQIANVTTQTLICKYPKCTVSL